MNHTGSSADESHRPQSPVDPLNTLRPFYRRVSAGAVSRACRAPCPSSSRHAWHPALLLDVRSRSGPRYGSGHVSGRTQFYCSHHAPPFCTSLTRGVSDFSQPRPSYFLSVIFVAHRLAAGPHPFLLRSTEWVEELGGWDDSSRDKDQQQSWQGNSSYSD